MPQPLWSFKVNAQPARSSIATPPLWTAHQYPQNQKREAADNDTDTGTLNRDRAGTDFDLEWPNATAFDDWRLQLQREEVVEFTCQKSYEWKTAPQARTIHYHCTSAYASSCTACCSSSPHYCSHTHPVPAKVSIHPPPPGAFFPFTFIPGPPPPGYPPFPPFPPVVPSPPLHNPFLYPFIPAPMRDSPHLAPRVHTKVVTSHTEKSVTDKVVRDI